MKLIVKIPYSIYTIGIKKTKALFKESLISMQLEHQVMIYLCLGRRPIFFTWAWDMIGKPSSIVSFRTRRVCNFFSFIFCFTLQLSYTKMIISIYLWSKKYYDICIILVHINNVWFGCKQTLTYPKTWHSIWNWFFLRVVENA